MNNHGIDEQTLKELALIRDTLAVMYEDYAAGPDVYWKSSEGHISLFFKPFYWWEEPYSDDPATRPGIEIYSYVFGPSRNHVFDNTTEALIAVQEWYDNYFNGWRGSIMEFYS